MQADSGRDMHLYRQLRQAPVVIADARAKSSSEHASFEELTESREFCTGLCHALMSCAFKRAYTPPYMRVGAAQCAHYW